MDSLLVATGLTSFALGAAMTTLAWSVVRQNRRREAARVTLLSGLAFPEGSPGPDPAGLLTIETIARHDALASDECPSERLPAAEPEALFREPEKSRAPARRTIALAAVCAVMTIAVGTFKMFSTADAPSTRVTALAPAPVSAAAPAAAATSASVTPPAARVELLALDHASTPAGLVVTGRLRNPADGASLHDVVAVVEVLDRSGRVLTTARASIGRASLNAGESSDFTVATVRTTEVARYRVVFHARERESVPQIDLRHAAPGLRSE
jgi:hypothetical protein